MKIREPKITDTGLIIDPDDDVKIIKHKDFQELIYDEHSIYCKAIHPCDDGN